MSVASPPAEAAPEARRRDRSSGITSSVNTISAVGPWLVVGATIAYLAGELRPNLSVVAYLDDNSVHQQMVRFAARRITEGHLPWTSWFPYLGLGSPQFLHYQSLPATLTGLLGLVIPPDRAFGWSLYVLMATWPLAIYWAARLLKLDRWSAAAAAALSPFIASYVGVGYEQHAYVWTGFGVWTQLWAMWFLPLAWALTWRAAADRRFVVPAALVAAFTVACHFETGYLTALGVLVVAILRLRHWRSDLVRLAVLSGLVLLLTAWVTVPLIVSKPWAATNEPLSHTALENGYGATRMLGWLVTGNFLDWGRAPVLTVLAAIGLIALFVTWRRMLGLAAVTILGAVCFVLSFGRTTFGPLVDLVPEHQDLFFRRFSMGAQLAAVFLAGFGLWMLLRLVRTLVERGITAWGGRPGWRVLFGSCLAIVFLAVCLVTFLPLTANYGGALGRDREAVAAQVDADHTQGRQLDRLLSLVKRQGGGRLYAGTPYNWGTSFTVGAVPVFKYVESQDVDEIGYTLRTASLMTDAEYYFDDRVPAEYAVFGIRYLLLPTATTPPVPARREAISGPYSLWVIPGGGYAHVVDVVSTVSETRSDLGARSLPLLTSRALAEGHYSVVRYKSGPVPRPRLPKATLRGSPGAVLAQGRGLAEGRLTTTVRARRAAVVAVSVTYDPGWHATVDGRPAVVFMLAPAIVGVEVPPGLHHVTLSYQGFHGYPGLFALGILTLVASVFWMVREFLKDRHRRRAVAPVVGRSCQRCGRDGGPNSSFCAWCGAALGP